MKRLLYVVVVAALGALVYVADPPGLPAEQSAAGGESVATVASSQSAVARLAEAGMAMRRHPVPVVGANDPAPQPDKLFGK